MHGLDLDEYVMVPPELRRVRVCAQCDARFCELANLGTHGCLVHPGVVLHARDAPHTARFYSCCGLRLPDGVVHQRAARGCLALDHSEASLCAPGDAEARLAALADFALVSVPALYERFMIAGHVAYESARAPPGAADLTLRAPALEAAAANHAHRLRAQPGFFAEAPLAAPPVVPALRVALEETRLAMAELGLASPLFARLLDESAERDSDAQRAYCEAHWPEEPGASRALDCRAFSVPFTVRARLASRLAYAL